MIHNFRMWAPLSGAMSNHARYRVSAGLLMAVCMSVVLVWV